MSRRLLAAAALTLACSVAGMLIALAAAGPYQKDTSLGQLEARASFSLSPGVDVYIPLADWGISFPVWKVPVSVHIEPRSLNRKAIAKVVGGDVSSLSRARRQVEEATVGALTRFLVFALLGALNKKNSKFYCVHVPGTSSKFLRFKCRLLKTLSVFTARRPASSWQPQEGIER